MRALLLAAAAVLSAACARPQDARIEVLVSAPGVTSAMKMELVADGVPARFLRWEERSGVKEPLFEVHATVTGKAKKIPALVLKVLFGCGWRERPVRLEQDWPAEEILAQNARGTAPLYEGDAEMFPGALASLWVDNRRGGPGELGLGPIRLSVPARQAAFFEVATCDSPIPVAYDGQPLGEIPAAGPYTGQPPTILIDPTKKRCYGVYTVWYGEPSYDGRGSGGRTTTELLSGRGVYYSKDFIAYVFEKPPLSRFAPQGETPHATVLEDAKCR